MNGATIYETIKDRMIELQNKGFDRSNKEVERAV